MAMIKSDISSNYRPPPIHRISVHSSSGVKKFCKMLPLCAERPTTYYSSDPRTSGSYHSENNYSRYYHTLSNSDSAYYSLLSTTVPVYPINNSNNDGGSLNREGKKHKRKNQQQKQLQQHHSSRHKNDSNENEKFDTLMLPQYLSLQNSNYCHQQSHYSQPNERQNNLTKFEKPSSMPTAAASPQQHQQQPLYTALLPRNKQDPTQPSTSSDVEQEVIPSSSMPSSTLKALTSNGITLPPNLLRIVNSTSKFSSHKLRLCLKLNETDSTNPKILFEYLPTEFDPANEPQFIFSVGSHKIFSFDTYDTVFPSKTSQQEICVNCLPELLQTLFAGFDASLMYFGAISRQKQDLLYSRIQYSPTSNGIFVCAIQWIFKLIEEYRIKKRDIRYSVRISALHYSQKSDKVIDLLSDFANEDNSENEVKCTEDPALGIIIENRSEIRVETVDQALYYLDRVHDHRASEEEEIQRSSHTFFYLTLYRYETHTSGLQSGKSRLCFIDLGLGEKNSKTGYMTMPVLGQILLAIFQGQKHLPSRQNTLCRLLKESIGSSKNKSTTVISTYSPVENRCPIETENLVQLASKMHKIAAKSISSPSNRMAYKGDHFRPHPLPQQPQSSMDPSTEYTSSSEQSCAETVIYVGPQHSHLSQPSSSSIGYNGALPPSGSSSTHSPLKRRSSKGSKGSFGSHGRKSSNVSGGNHSGCNDPQQQQLQVIPIDCPPNAVIHSSASFQSLSVNNSPKRPTHLFQRAGNSMPGTPVQSRSARQSSVPTDLILCNPMARTMSPKPIAASGSLKRTQKQKENNLDDEFYNIDPEKRDMVLNWVIEQKVEFGNDICGIGKPFPASSSTSDYPKCRQGKVDVCIQCNEDEIDAELLNIIQNARFLDDIVEDEEEASTASASALTRSLTAGITTINGHKREALAEIEAISEKPLKILTKQSDLLGELSLLALERLSIKGDDDEEDDDQDLELSDDEELEKAMAASISSIKSHEILSKMVTEFPNNEIATTSLLADSFTASTASTKVPTEMDFYRRASHLESYAAERLKELQNLESKKDFISAGLKQVKDAISKQLCPQMEQSTVTNESSSTCYKKTSIPAGPEKKKKEESLLSKFKLKQLSCCNAMTTSSTSSASIGTNTIHSSFNNPLKTIKVSTTIPPRLEKSKTSLEEEESEPKIVSPLPPEIAKQITDQLRNAGLGKAPTAATAAAASMIPTAAGLQKPKLHSQSSCSSPIRSGIPQSAYSMKDLRKTSTNSTRTRKDSAESVAARKMNNQQKGKSRRNSADSAKSSTVIIASSASATANHLPSAAVTEKTHLPSPYSKVTTAKSPLNGAYSSGHGSDETNSNPGQPNSGTTTTTLLPRPIQPGTGSKIPSNNSLLIGSAKNRPRNRESFSASSGYESADYGKYRNAITSPDLINESKLKKPSSASTVIAQKEAASLKQLRDSLKQQLSEAKKRIGLDEEVIVESDERYRGLAPEIVVDLLAQETRMLEKRLITCQNQVMMVTTFL